MDRTHAPELLTWVTGELGRLAPQLDGGEGFLANTLSAADFSLYPYLALQRRAGQKEPSASIMGEVDARLLTWMTRIEALPFFDRTYPPHWR